MKTKVVVNKRNKFVLRWFDEATQRWKERSTGLDSVESNRGKAHQMLAKLQDELLGQAPPAWTAPRVSNTTEFFGVMDRPDHASTGRWDDYFAYYKRNHLVNFTGKHASSMKTALTRFQAFTGVQYLREINTPMVRRWVTSLQDGKLAKATVHSYWRYLRAFLQFAQEEGLLTDVPKVRLPKLDQTSLSKGRALSGEEFDRMVAAVDTLRPIHGEGWKYLLRGLWASGLRIGEACRLTWEPSDFYVDLDRLYPVLVIAGAAQKSRKSQTLPIAPEFAELLKETPVSQRRGKVFKCRGESGRLVCAAFVALAISAFGRAANIRVGKNKMASAHDLRRTFGSRWALKVLPQVLQQMMRHSDIQTTMRYYVDITASDLGKAIYTANEKNREHDSVDRPGRTRRQKASG
jgi:integrase